MERGSKGLTLIELGVVISIIAILVFAVAPRFMDMQTSAEEASAYKLLNNLKTATMFYVAQEGQNPDSFDDFTIVTGQTNGSKNYIIR